MPSKRKLEKRKRREKVGKEKALARRLDLIKKKAEENAERKREIRLKKLQKDMYELDQWADMRSLAELDNATITQLEKNVEILKGLEKEFDKEKTQRESLNEELEEQGAVTLDQKMKVLQDREKAKQQAAQVGVGGSAECSMSTNDSSVVKDQAVS